MTEITGDRPPTQPGFLEVVTPIPAEFVRNGTSGKKKAVYGGAALLAMLGAALGTIKYLELDVGEHHEAIADHDGRIKTNEQSIRIIRIGFGELEETVDEGQKKIFTSLEELKEEAHTQKEKRLERDLEEARRENRRLRRGR